MNRPSAIDLATEYFDSGRFKSDLARRVAIRTESQDPDSGPELRRYLGEQIIPDVERLGFSAHVVDNPVSPQHPFLIAERREGDSLPTVLTYGHGDVQRAHAKSWRDGLDPWKVTVDGERWYGRGTADNKGQHTVNLGALEQVLKARNGRLGFNAKVLIDMGEESGSPGLEEVCALHKDALAADLLLASDGPRLAADLPTLFLGSRGAANFTLKFRARDESHHSGNWGGVLSNPAIVIANALAAMVDGHGTLLVDGLRPPTIPAAVRSALAKISVDDSPDSPRVDPGWGEPGLTPSERLFGWNTLEVLAMIAGNPDGPVNAIPNEARAHCQLRFVVGTNAADIEAILRKHLDDHGFPMVEVDVEHMMPATRLDPEDPWVTWALKSIQETTGKDAGLLPNLGGSLPNSAFAHVLGLPTIWIPHSYPGCAQHAPNEHLLGSLMREALQIMAGLFWDLGEA
ncbi:M20 family metallopeptidase [Spelaeicoccus albus]|uniref:Acetylornithine deacetylase/succinyl-diaminopimelate desuccinylase-like protein n=1 Tax=Spelaeicoccus albus TaxID=1280376 RepID=A0A7Z0D1S2_9MICO|nr:M20 family metallopeptidase [Spelaeicoccus albus]NYI66762.1 acetylornithine deacetylase/succinyl-diaminopimelate desuccinylase-like protein [Spelaeicoccus albus]